MNFDRWASAALAAALMAGCGRKADDVPPPPPPSADSALQAELAARAAADLAAAEQGAAAAAPAAPPGEWTGSGRRLVLPRGDQGWARTDRDADGYRKAPPDEAGAALD